MWQSGNRLFPLLQSLLAPRLCARWGVLVEILKCLAGRTVRRELSKGAHTPLNYGSEQLKLKKPSLSKTSPMHQVVSQLTQGN